MTFKQMASSQTAAGPGEPAAMNYDIVRGVLILIVMLDHNDIIRDVRAVNEWFLPMTFHVAGFLLLPFLVRPKRLSLAMIGDHAIRYLTPFFFALVLYATAFRILVAHHMAAGDWLTRVATAFVIASPSSLHDATGFIVLWFLPALLSLVLLKAVYDAAPRRWRMIILGPAVTIHLTVGGFSDLAKSEIPQGWLIALYMFPLGLACRSLIPWLSTRKRDLSIVGMSCLVLLLCWLFERGSEVEVATLVLPTIGQPLRVLATDASDLAFLSALVVGSRYLGRVPVLPLLGRFSLVIYLIHPLIYKPVLGFLLPYCKHVDLSRPDGWLLYWAAAIASVVIVAGVSLAMAASLQGWNFARKLVTPRGRDEWLVFAPKGRVHPQSV